jgi:hypothetical protein
MLHSSPLASSRLKQCLLGSALLLGLSGCINVQDNDRNVTAQAGPLLPISHNELMVALVNHAADPIWIAAWRNPRTDREWRELERLAYQIEVGGALLQIPGTGPLDAAWAANPQWREYAAQLSQVGARGVTAARDRDVAQIARVGDDLVEVCESCHQQFKPDLPTMDMFGELSPLPPVSVQ